MAGMPGDPFSMVSAHNDDQGHLIARSLTYNATMSDATEGSVTKAAGRRVHAGAERVSLLVPDGHPGEQPGDAGDDRGRRGTAGTLIGDFSAMVGGVGILGCGIESQLESWYRFLIQPDPYATLVARTASTPAGEWVGVDTTILQQRHDFLRPDSLVAVIVLTDENDSEIDVRSLGGQGYHFMSTSFAPPQRDVGVRDEPGRSRRARRAASTRPTRRCTRHRRAVPAYTRRTTGATTSTCATCT